MMPLFSYHSQDRVEQYLTACLEMSHTVFELSVSFLWQRSKLFSLVHKGVVWMGFIEALFTGAIEDNF